VSPVYGGISPAHRPSSFCAANAERWATKREVGRGNAGIPPDVRSMTPSIFSTKSHWGLDTPSESHILATAGKPGRDPKLFRGHNIEPFKVIPRGH
jgi:hypothetical protein